MASPLFRPRTPQRYLNPAKLCLLALIELYCEDVVGDAGTLPVLEFITAYVLTDHRSLRPPDDHDDDPSDKAHRTMDIVASIKPFETALRPLAAAPPRSVWDVFLQRLWTIDSLHVLHSFLHARGALIQPPRQRGYQDMLPPGSAIVVRLGAGGRSPFGAFVTRAVSEFERLRFDDMAALWKQFVVYRQPTADYMERRSRDFSRLSYDSVLLEGAPAWGQRTERVAETVYTDMLTGGKPPVPVTVDDLERLIDFQIKQMQKFGIRIPRRIENKFQQFLNDAVVVPTARHYLSFLSAWRRGDYTASLEHIHRYFDNAALDRRQPYYPYAMMTLAICSADFGCYREAVTAILQCVTTAQDSKDTACLNHALNWLLHFTQQHPEYLADVEAASTLGAGEQGLAALRTRAKDARMWVLVAAALLGEARLVLQHGGSVAAAFAKLVRTSQILLHYDLDAMRGALCSVAIPLWDRLGLPVLADSDAHHFLYWSGGGIVEDKIRVINRLAMHLAAQGQYDAAFAVLERAVDHTSLRTFRVRAYWAKARAIVRATRQLHRDNLGAASQTIRQLVQQKPDDHLEPDLVAAVDALHVELLVRQNDLPAAFAAVHTLIGNEAAHAGGGGDVSVRVRLMLLKAQIYIRAGRPQKALTLCVRAASTARRALLLVLLWEAVGRLAQVLVSLGEFGAAERLLCAVLPRALETDGAALAGELWTTLAGARMGLAGKEAAGSEERKEWMVGAHRALGMADGHWEQLGEVVARREGWAMCAVMMRAAGEEQLAEEYAGRYVAAREDEREPEVYDQEWAFGGKRDSLEQKSEPLSPIHSPPDWPMMPVEQGPRQVRPSWRRSIR